MKKIILAVIISLFLTGNVFATDTLKELYNKEIEKLTKAIEIEPNHFGALNLRAHLYLDKGDYDKAIEDWQVICEQGNTWACLKVNETKGLKDPSKGVEAYVYSSKEDEAWDLVSKGTTYANKGQYDRAIEINPNYADAYIFI